jgi:phage-related minor tail protein
MTDDFDSTESRLPGFLPETVDKVHESTRALGVSTAAFAKAIGRAFADATAGGKQFDDVLKQLALRMSGMAVTQAFNPIAKMLAGDLGKVFGGSSGGGADSSGNALSGTVIPFAAGGVIGAPSYFPLPGGVGLAGEAGPEAIVPLTRGSDGRLGIAMSGAGQGPNITVQIATPDIDSFRRSEAYLTSQIARAVARGQRGF